MTFAPLTALRLQVRGWVATHLDASSGGALLGRLLSSAVFPLAGWMVYELAPGPGRWYGVAMALFGAFLVGVTTYTAWCWWDLRRSGGFVSALADAVIVEAFDMPSLTIASTPDLEQALVEAWGWRLPPGRVLELTVLGDVIWQDDASGAIHWLDTPGGHLTRIADDADAFDELWWTDAPLARRIYRQTLVDALRERGPVPRAGECCVPVALPFDEPAGLAVEGWRVENAEAHFRSTGDFHRARRPA